MKHLYGLSFKNEQSYFCFMFDSPVGEAPQRQCEGSASLFSEPEGRSSCPPPLTEEIHAESCESEAHIQTPTCSPAGANSSSHFLSPVKGGSLHIFTSPRLSAGFPVCSDSFRLQKKDEDRIAAPFWTTPYAINLFLDSNVRTARVILRRVEISAKRG